LIQEAKMDSQSIRAAAHASACSPTKQSITPPCLSTSSIRCLLPLTRIRPGLLANLLTC
jgi:hypothetical protein